MSETRWSSFRAWASAVRRRALVWEGIKLRISNIQVARKQCLVKFLEAIRAIRQKVKDPSQIEPRVVPGARLRDIPAGDGGRDSGHQLMLPGNRGRTGFCQCIPAELGFLAC